mmetsp:Transcript_116181/g.339815  ORF Transcript_116181/g.339815 Transcript_116181/m.339815 type:complete len:170 (+) Transcript_116181:409-918(+)
MLEGRSRAEGEWLRLRPADIRGTVARCPGGGVARRAGSGCHEPAATAVHELPHATCTPDNPATGGTGRLPLLEDCRKPAGGGGEPWRQAPAGRPAAAGAADADALGSAAGVDSERPPDGAGEASELCVPTAGTVARLPRQLLVATITCGGGAAALRPSGAETPRCGEAQ